LNCDRSLNNSELGSTRLRAGRDLVMRIAGVSHARRGYQ
jgi:hypothetical protein